MPRLVSVDDAFNLPDSVNVRDTNLPANLQPAALSATYGPNAPGFAPGARMDLPAVSFSATQPITSGIETALTTSSPVTYFGATPSIYAGAVTSAQRGGQIGFRFNSYGQNVAIKVVPQSTSATVRVKVGGNLVTVRAGAAVPGAVANTAQYILLAFPTAQLRTIEISGKESNWAAIVTDPTGSYAPAPDTSNVRLAVLGDSWTGGALTTSAMNTFAAQLGDRLGIKQPITAGVGGTGYVNGGPGAGSYTFPFTDATQRLAAIVAAAPTDILIAGSVNDSGSTLAAIKTAAASVFSYFNTNLPSARLHVMLPQPGTPATQNSTNMAVNRTAVLQAAQEAPNVYTILRPVSENWLTGTGNAGSPANDGNRDRFLSSDGVHLTQDGHDYFADMTAGKLANLIATVKAGGTVTPLPNITTYAFDDFNRADGAIGSTVDGKAYQTADGTLQTVGNVAKATTVGNASKGAIAVVETSVANAVITATVGGGTWGMGLALRMSADLSTGYILVANTSQYTLQKREAGGVTTVGTFARTVVAGETIKLTMSGSNFTLAVNGAQVGGTVTDATYTGTKHGIAIQNAARTIEDLTISSS
jgi:lysophospholipase L1-like esterase